MPTLAGSHHRSPWDFAKALRECADKHGPHLELIPFNRYEPQTTLWWLSPHKDPAYKAGKIAIGDKGLLPNFLVGLYVEKGIGSTAAPVFTTDRDRRLLIKEDWVWHDFAKELSKGEVAAICTELQARTGQPPILAVDAQAIGPSESWYAERYSLPRDFACYEIEGDTLTQLSCDLEANVAPALAKLSSLADLSKLVRDVEKPDWIWFDVQIGYVFSPELGEEPPWETQRIWDVVCNSWRDWFRPGT